MKPSYVFESPDGGETVYRRELGTNRRELHHISTRKSDSLTETARTQLWHNIRQVSKNDPALAEMLNQVETYYRLKHQSWGGQD